MTKLIASLLIGAAGMTGAGGHDLRPSAAADQPPPAARPAPRLLCPLPPELRLVRFEDGSARLECGRRLLVRVAVPW